MAQFLNVYNFIPFPEKKAEHYLDTDKHTGVITYTITTKTPLFIPNTSNDDAFKMLTDPDKKGNVEKHNSYDFYSYREMNESKNYSNDLAVPVIPGSELRGMVRNIYETLTDSCMGVLNGENVPVIRPGTSAAFKAGLLVKAGKDKYTLEPAENLTYRDRSDPGKKLYLDRNPYEGSKVFVQISENGKYIRRYNFREGNGCEVEGYVLKGMKDGGFNKKKGLHIFVASEDAEKIELDGRDIERLKRVIDSYQKQPTAPKFCYKDYEKQLECFLIDNRVEKLPVYYAELTDENQNKLVYLSPACITKEISHHSIGDLAGKMKPCKIIEKCCPACDLFGKIGTDNENAKASKIRFADAHVTKQKDIREYYDKIITLPALAEQKLGCAEFYLKKPEEGAKFWTYDYYIDQNDELVINQGNLRGRKYYWHQPGVKLPERVPKTILNKTIRPVTDGVEFEGKVYFDNISDKQLEQLKWILNGGEKHSLAYKLGGGKPLGMGSVQCKVTGIKERTIHWQDKNVLYTEKETPENEITISNYDDKLFRTNIKKEFLLMSDYQAIKKIRERAKDSKVIISYPITWRQYNTMGRPQNQIWVAEGYRWFVENHKAPTREITVKRGHVVNAELPKLELEFNKEGRLILNSHPCMPMH